MAREMKDSGVEWIGAIPKDWGSLSAKHYINIFNGREVTFESTKSETSYDVFGSGGVFKFTEAYLYDGEAVLFGRKGTIGKPLYVNQKFWTVDTMYYSTMTRRAYAKFIFYLFCVFDWERITTQTALPSIVGTVVGNQKMPLVSLHDQYRIANYLDTKCSEIDAMVEKTKTTIEEYKKLKQSIITEAVTKGLDSTVPMKDSGVEWIGEIPEHWSNINLSRMIVSTMNGLTRRSNDEENVGTIVLRLREISEQRIHYENISRIRLNKDELDKYTLQTNDVLFVRVNGSKDLVGKCAIFQEIEEVVAFNDHIIKVKLNDDTSVNFIAYYLSGDAGKVQIQNNVNTSAGQYTISGAALRKLKVSIPSLDEQIQIVDYLDRQCQEIDILIEKKQTIITELEQYKKSLIYECVTGKREV